MFNLQSTILIKEKEYPINTNFRTWIKFQDIVENLKGDEESFYSLLSFFDELGLNFDINLFNDVLQEVVAFFIGEKNGQNEKETNSKKVFDLKQDERYIYSSFLQEYGIDLYQIQNLHWHQFKYLLESLSENCQLSKIIQYRTIDISKLSKEQKAFYRNMKRKYSLENKEKAFTAEEHHNNLLEKIKRRFEEVENIKNKRG